MKAPSHPRQIERLRALRSFEILDTDPEQPFDDIVQLAARICEVPIALVSLVERGRQWFKAEVGLGTPETPIEQSICAHAILEEDGFLEIPDTLDDPRTVGNTLCCGAPNLRFYAGAPLVTDSGLPIGTLCVLDTKPNALTPLQRDTMKVLARQVMLQLDLRRALTLADTMRSEIDHRVKNSLQTVSALTRLQSRGTVSDDTREALELVSRRIETVAALHERLYRSESGNHVDAGKFVEDVAGFVSQDWPDQVQVEVRTEPFYLSAQQAGAVGVILNEFASNAWKHAFAERGEGRLTVTAGVRPDGFAELVVEDDGPGVASGTPDRDGLGMQIVDASVAQLEGVLDIDTDGRLCARVVFPIETGMLMETAAE